MKIRRDQHHKAFLDALEDTDAIRIKEIRDEELVPGGRAHVRVFEQAGGRAHPRFHVHVPPAVDPTPPRFSFAPATKPTDVEALRVAIEEAYAAAKTVLRAEDLDPDDAPEGSEHYWRNSISAQRRLAFFAEVREAVEKWIAADVLPARASRRAVRLLEDDAFTGKIQFDDVDTGTYHSYQNDEPFVHYLEKLLASLPVEGSEAMAVLEPAAQTAIRRQRKQLLAHLDDLMRWKFAHKGIDERDIETTLGGLLVDRETRMIVSEVVDPDALAPAYEVLRIDPRADHADAGEWVHRDADGRIRRQDGTVVEVDPAALRSAPREPEQLTFQRAVGDARLRKGIRFDWDDGGFVQDGAIEWVSWAGHCDVKAVLEALGIGLKDQPAVHEFRSDTGKTQVYGRDLLLEMVASIVELGSDYASLDGTRTAEQGTRAFGGSRNDARPDRLQLTGPQKGRGFRWPFEGRKDELVVKAITFADGTKADMGRVFHRHVPVARKIDFVRNERFLKTVEGDYNIIDVTGATIVADVLVDVVDPQSGYIGQERQETTIVLREGARGEHRGRFLLGSHVDDYEKRRLFRVYFDAKECTIVRELEVYEREGGRWVAKRRPGEDVVMPMKTPLVCTLSRECKRDDPAQYQAMLELALRRALNICADTEAKSAVWNGVVTKLDVDKIADDRETGVQRWRIGMVARFGEATLDWLVRRDQSGNPVEFCPAVPDTDSATWPDFLWLEIPDVGTKAFVDRRWLVNSSMVDRGIVEVEPDSSVAGGFYVHDDHVKNVFELVYCGLSGQRFTIVHGNKRYGFASEAAWKKAVDRVETLRGALSFDE